MSDKEEVNLGWEGRLCCECNLPAVLYFPAYEPNVSPSPYCETHYREAKSKTELKGPNFMELARKTMRES